MSGSLCGCACGRPARTAGYASACYKRWLAAGKPETGPPAPLTQAETARRSALARSDPYDLEWLAGEPERRVRRVRAQAAALVRCMAADDAEGIRILLQERVTDWVALAVVLAECADPARTAIVCGPTLAVVRTPASPAGEAPPAQPEAGSVDHRTSRDGADEAA